MRNPLRKRLLRELKEEAGKYAVIFLLMILCGQQHDHSLQQQL